MLDLSPKITTIIPTYNRAHFINEAIRSVLRQTFTDFELIIVDDGSTDNTSQVVQSFNDSRLHYLYQENKGISAAVNCGIRRARGEYISRLDSDDIWLPEMLALCVAVLDSRPEVGLVHGRGQGMDEHGNLLNEFRGRPEWFSGEAFRSMLYGDFTCNITIMVRRSCFDRAGLFDESLPLNEDWDMWLHVAQHYRFAFINQIVARYRYHPGNVTGARSKYLTEHLNSRIKVLDKIFQQSGLPPAILQMKSISYFNLYSFRGFSWLQHRNYRLAFVCFKHAWQVRHHSFLALAKILWSIFASCVLSQMKWGRALAEKMTEWGRHV